MYCYICDETERAPAEMRDMLLERMGETPWGDSTGANGKPKYRNQEKTFSLFDK